MKPSEAVKEFHDAFEVERGDTHDNRKLRAVLLAEELFELLEALLGTHAASGLQYEPLGVTRDIREAQSLEEIAKELADVVVVTYGTADVLGIDLDKAFDLVHESNMSKLGEDGKPIRREDGKVLKGPNYKAPDMSEAVLR